MRYDRVPEYLYEEEPLVSPVQDLSPEVAQDGLLGEKSLSRKGPPKVDAGEPLQGEKMALGAPRRSVLLETPESSQVESALWVASLENLIVWFRSGAIYSYNDVDEALFREFQEAPSKGSFIQTLSVYTRIKGKS